MHLRSLASRQQQISPSVAAARRLSRTPFFELPWQAVLLVAILTMGAAVHRFPAVFRPLLQYTNGMALAAAEWHSTSPASTCATNGI